MKVMQFVLPEKDKRDGMHDRWAASCEALSTTANVTDEGNTSLLRVRALVAHDDGINFGMDLGTRQILSAHL